MLTLYIMDAKPAQPAFLDDIIFDKRQEVTALKVHLNIPRVKQLIKSLPPPRNFLKVFKPGRLALIAELKKASPSAGVIVRRFEPISLAKVYEESGAAALSVLTDEKYFQGKLENLAKAKESTTVPVLRKDFIIDESQLYESRVAGADAVLLIAGVLTDEELKRFLLLAGTLRLVCLVEVHNEAELERALQTSARLIGINNRDLETFNVDLNTTIRLIDKYPELQKRTVIAESGIASAEQVRALKAKGVAGILVGESLLRSRDIGAKIRELMQ